MDIIEFETPENVRVRYEVAGLGSRFVAWVEDQLLASLLMFIIGLVLFFLGMSSTWVSEFMMELNPEKSNEAMLYFLGLMVLLVSLSNFIYFGLSELLMRGQTIGKKHASVRVVKVNGYALDTGSILIRNVFRVIDHIPVLWLVPMFAPRSQRLGDMVAGTVVVADDPKKLGTLREVLAARNPAEREFRFDLSALKRARPTDIHAVERIFESRHELPDEKVTELVGLLCDPLAERMQIHPPEASRRIQFLEDLLASEYQRQQRTIG